MPLVQQDTKAAPGAQVGLWPIQETEAELRAGLPLTAQDEQMLARIRVPSRRLQYLATRRALRELLALAPEVEIHRATCGKPVLNPNTHEVSFTNTPDMIGVTADPQRPVAIDLERLDRRRNPRIRHLFMNPEEIAYYEAAPCPERLLLFWCGKECLSKLYSEEHCELSFRQELAITPPEGPLAHEGRLTATLHHRTPTPQAHTLYYRFTERFLLMHT
jgi:hypothetical protein